MEITSPSNPKLKYVVKLRSCSTREESGEMIVEGYRECRRALDNGYRPRAIFHCPEFYLKNENEPTLVEDCARLGAEVYTCSKTCFSKIAYKERPDGLLMVGPHVSIKLADLKLPENALVIVTEAIRPEAPRERACDSHRGDREAGQPRDYPPLGRRCESRGRHSLRPHDRHPQSECRPRVYGNDVHRADSRGDFG